MKEYFKILKQKFQNFGKNFKKVLNNVKIKSTFLYIGKVAQKIYGMIFNKINIAGTYLGKIGISANAVSWAGFAIGIFAINFISMEMYGWALLAIILNRLCDGLDGAIARSTKVTDFGVFLDACLDYIFYGGVIFAFALANQAENALAAACMLMGFASAACATLAYSVIAYKNNSDNQLNLDHSPFYLGGLLQGSETLVALIILCLFPSWFPVMAIMLGVLSLIKAFSLIVAAYYNFVIVPFNKGK